MLGIISCRSREIMQHLRVQTRKVDVCHSLESFFRQDCEKRLHPIRGSSERLSRFARDCSLPDLAATESARGLSLSRRRLGRPVVHGIQRLCTSTNHELVRELLGLFPIRPAMLLHPLDKLGRDLGGE